VAGILLSSGHDQRCTGNAGVPKATEAVAKPTRRVKIDESCAARGLCVTIGHRDNARFLEGPDIADIGKVDQSVDEGQLRRAWIAEDVLHTFAAENFEQQSRASAAARLVEFRNRICFQAGFICLRKQFALPDSLLRRLSQKMLRICAGINLLL